MNEHEALYAASASALGIIVRGSARRLREARAGVRGDLALADLAILGPDSAGEVWIVRKDKISQHLEGEKDVSR
jgi:hypothetical protein